MWYFTLCRLAISYLTLRLIQSDFRVRYNRRLKVIAHWVEIFIRVFSYSYPKNVSRTETLHTESDAELIIRCETISKTVLMESSSSEEDFVGWEYWVHPILRYREDRVPLLIKEQRIITGDSKFTSGYQWLSLMLSDTRATLQCFVLRDEVDELDNRYSGFWVRLYGGSELSKHLSKCYGTKKSNPIRMFLWGRSFWRQCVNVLRIIFSTCKNFGLRVQWPWVRNFRTLKNKHDLTLCQSRLHNASETFICHKNYD